MIDPRIPLVGSQQQDPFNQLANNIELGQGLRQLIAGRQIGRMRQLSTPEAQKEFANNSMFGRELNAQLRADQLSAAKAEQDALKAQAEIGNINAQAAERNANAGNTSQKTNLGKFGAIQGAFQQAALSGDKNTALLALNGLQRAGAITPEEYSQQFEVVQAMTPDEFKTYASGLASSNKDVSPYLFQTANNAADNATTMRGQDISSETTRRGQDISAQTAANDLAQEKIIKEQELALKRGEFETMTGTDGKAYAVYKDGRVEPLLLSSGANLNLQGKTNNPQSEERQRINRVDAVLNEIEDILPQSTSSYLGRGVDYLARGVGAATPGDIASGKLGTLGGQLVALMPKMSGPQSDKDVAMYKQMAGQLDDATIPLKIRQAALETIRSLNNKYAEMNSQNQTTIPYRNTTQQEGNVDQGKLNSILFGR
ncbi:hypothetical protein [Acinetobacter sp. Ac_5812]|uniref:hypothetical protein n=1 Tax=Acinetobacter sp. Ac_5812 TaxID=1848937 RepID=UPI00148FAD9F|nr:hypothetical protein [Acinetobacter sp. Ac_5812]NNP70927.1 hypothetical protein [Acinetobacter sp. Ac_5812]